MAFLHGVHTPHRKNTAGKTAERLTEVKTVVLPTQMHIGAPATPAVKVGDLVKVGTLVAEGTGAVSSPIYSSVSGKVTKIADVLTSNGKTFELVSDSCTFPGFEGSESNKKPANKEDKDENKDKDKNNSEDDSEDDSI